MDRKIKVAHIITKLELGGAQDNTLYTLEHLDREKFEPILICGTGGILDERAKKIDIKAYFLKDLIRETVSFRHPFSSLIHDYHAYKEIIDILKQEKPDIVHTHSSKAGVNGRIAAWRAGVKVIIHTYHGFSFNKFQGFLKRNTYIFAEWLAAKASTALIAVSNNNIRTLLENNIGRKEQYTLIRSGIKISKYTGSEHERAAKRLELGISNGRKLITTIGPFKPQKNLLDFVRAAGIIAAGREDAKFIIVGDGDLRPQIEKEATRLGLNERLTLLGWRQDIPAILAATDVFVMTSLWEGLPRSVLEAMCSGLPVVANKVDGVAEVVEDGVTGFLTDPFDVKGTAERVASLLENDKLRTDMGMAGRSRVDESFDIDRMVRRQETLYKGLNNGRG